MQRVDSDVQPPSIEGACPFPDVGKVPDTAQARLDEDSLLVRYAGDLRNGFSIYSAGALQVLHPAIGAAVRDHSRFFSDPWQRIQQTVPPTIGGVYDGEDAVESAHAVRDFHKNIKGVDHNGQAYHALNPESWAWAHETIYKMIEDTIRHYTREELTPEVLERLYQDSILWYGRYGVSDRAIMPTHEEFEKKFQDVCDNILEMTPAAEEGFRVLEGRNVPKTPYTPDRLWRIARIPVSESVRLLTIGGLPESVRERFELPWKRSDEVALNSLRRCVREGSRLTPLVPKRFRYHPRALTAPGCPAVTTTRSTV